MNSNMDFDWGFYLHDFNDADFFCGILDGFGCDCSFGVVALCGTLSLVFARDPRLWEIL
jgi:hypothetical protein